MYTITAIVIVILLIRLALRISNWRKLARLRRQAENAYLPENLLRREQDKKE
jgi:hypothetical protein